MQAYSRTQNEQGMERAPYPAALQSFEKITVDVHLVADDDEGIWITVRNNVAQARDFILGDDNVQNLAGFVGIGSDACPLGNAAVQPAQDRIRQLVLSLGNDFYLDIGC